MSLNALLASYFDKPTGQDMSPASLRAVPDTSPAPPPPAPAPAPEPPPPSVPTPAPTSPAPTAAAPAPRLAAGRTARTASQDEIETFRTVTGVDVGQAVEAVKRYAARGLSLQEMVNAHMDGGQHGPAAVAGSTPAANGVAAGTEAAAAAESPPTTPARLNFDQIIGTSQVKRWYGEGWMGE